MVTCFSFLQPLNALEAIAVTLYVFPLAFTVEGIFAVVMFLDFGLFKVTVEPDLLTVYILYASLNFLEAVP